MRRPTTYFLAAALGAAACLLLLIFKRGNGLTTPLALFAIWTVTMLVLGLKERA